MSENGRNKDDCISAKGAGQKTKGPHWFKSFFIGFCAAGAGIDILTYVAEGIAAWALDTLLIKMVSSAGVSVLTMIARLVISKIIKSKRNCGGTAMKNFFRKIGSFFKRCFAYIKANKRTLGGIISGALSGTLSVSVCVLGYTLNLTDLITANISELAWLQSLKVNGFDITPIVALIVGVLFAVWNVVAAVSRGWESPETCTANNAAEAEKKAETKRLRAEEKAAAIAAAEAEEEKCKAKAEAEAELIAEQQAQAEQAEQEKRNAEAAKLEAEQKAKDEKHRELVELYKRQILENITGDQGSN